MKVWWILFIIFLPILASCSQEEVMYNLYDRETAAVVDEIHDGLFARDYYVIADAATDEFRYTKNIKDSILQLFEYLPEGDVKSKELSGIHLSNVTTSGGVSTLQTNVVHDINVDDNWVRVSLVLYGENPFKKLQYFHVVNVDGPYSEQSKFSLTGESPVHYMVLVVMFALPIFIISTLIACIRTNGVRLKWLWCIFILFGLWGLEFNWATGGFSTSFIERTNMGVHLQIIEFKLLGVAVMQNAMSGAWIIEFGLPLGAILFWAYKRKLRPKYLREVESQF